MEMSKEMLSISRVTSFPSTHSVIVSFGAFGSPHDSLQPDTRALTIGELNTSGLERGPDRSDCISAETFLPRPFSVTNDGR